MADYLATLAEERARASRRKCFISYYSADTDEVDDFLEDFDAALISKVIGVTDSDDFIDSEDSDYVMSRLRDEYLGDSTVTICLIGSCTHSRRYVDWELKASLRQGSYIPNGLLGIVLPSRQNSAVLPQRFKDNWSRDDKGYALYRSYPTAVSTLRSWIEECYDRRETHANLISNSQGMFRYNHKCLVHDITH